MHVRAAPIRVDLDEVDAAMNVIPDANDALADRGRGSSSEDHDLRPAACRCGLLTPLCENIRAVAAMQGPEMGQVLDASGAALLLMVSTKTVLKLARAGELPARKVGREWRFETSALLDHVARRASA